MLATCSRLPISSTLDSGDLPWGLALARAAREKRAMMENCIFAVESI